MQIAALPIVIAGLALIAPQAGFGVGTAAGGKQSTTVTISSSVPAFHGQVKSGSKRCESNRRVQLYRKRAGKDPKFLGRDVTSGSGRWQVYPEVDRCGWFAPPAAKRKINAAQAELISDESTLLSFRRVFETFIEQLPGDPWARAGEMKERFKLL